MFTIHELETIPLFSALEDKALEYLAGEVEDVHLLPGEYVAYEGESRALAIVVEGKAELTKMVNGIEQVIGVRVAGDLGGEIPMTLGTPLPASMRAVEPTRVLKMTVEVFHTLAAMAPEVSAAVGAAALERLDMLKYATAQPVAPALLVIGPRLDPAVHRCDNFLHRNQIPYHRLDPDDAGAIALGNGVVAAGPYPVVVHEGTQLAAPTMRAVARAAGLTVAPSSPRYDVVIVGGGPAGLTAAVNGASEGLQTVLIESFAPGGQAGTSTRIENYTGFPFGVSGDELASRALQQAKRLGAEIVVTRRVEAIDPADMTITLDGGDVIQTRSIVLATGVQWRHLEVDSVDRFVGAGVDHRAARSDASLAHGNDVYLVGGGNSAGQAALFLLQPRPIGDAACAGGESLAESMSTYLIEQIATKANITVGDPFRGCRGARRRAARGDRGHRSKNRHHVSTRCDGALRSHRRPSGDGLAPRRDRPRRARIRLYGNRCHHSGTVEARTPAVPARNQRPGHLRRRRHPQSGSVKRVAASVGEGGVAIALVHRYLQPSPRP